MSQASAPSVGKNVNYVVLVVGVGQNRQTEKRCMIIWCRGTHASKSTLKKANEHF